MEEDSDLGYYDDLAGRHLGQSGLTNPPLEEQCRRTVYTV